MFNFRSRKAGVILGTRAVDISSASSKYDTQKTTFMKLGNLKEYFYFTN